MSEPVLLLPGSVLPAGPAYQALLPLLGDDVEAVTKDLELYAGPEVAPGWSLATEADGVLREADERGWDAFHLVAYSGGASAALVLATRAPERLRSLALLEPPWAGRWGWSAAHRELWRRYDELSALPDDEYVDAFRRIQVRPEAALPPTPPGPPPPWMATRPDPISELLIDRPIRNGSASDAGWSSLTRSRRVSNASSSDQP